MIKTLTRINKQININQKQFSILLPPPNVSGSLHIGHALTSFLQDCLGRLASLLVGKDNTFLLPGLDHGGISTQYSALKNIQDLQSKSKEEKTQIVYEFAQQAQYNIINQIEHFNLIANMDLLQYTMNDSHIKRVNEAFVTLYKKGLIYEEERIIYWDTYFNSSLSSLEIKHENKKDKLYYIKYALENGKQVTIATTRPETMFGDVALAVGERNKELVGKTAFVPIINRKIPIIFEETVLDDFGTGVLKITPGHDETDFNIGKKHNLPIISILDKNFRFNEKVPSAYQGLNCKEARDLLIEELNRLGLLEKEEIITHNIMYGEKSGTPIETIVKKQWYLDLSKAAKKSVELLEKEEWHIFPQQWTSSYKSWMNNLQPWCISREILWGHPIPVWRKNTGEIIVAVSQEEADKQAKGDTLVRDDFVLDTWFSSALWPFAYEVFPTTVLVTGYDILFFWVARMMMMSLELTNTLPFKQVLLHELVRDGAGQKMSKTRGNVSNPLELIEEYGADVVRYSLLSKISVRGKICFSAKDIETSKKLYNKIKNVITFLEMHFDQKDFDDYRNMNSVVINDEIAVYFVNKLEQVPIVELFNNYNLDAYLDWLYHFFWHDYCDWLIEMSKKQMFNEDIKFALIYGIDRILAYFYGIFPEKVERVYEKLFKSKPQLKNIIIETQLNIENNNRYIDDLMFVISQIRSLQGNNLIVYVDTKLEKEKLVFESLRIPLKSSYDDTENHILEKIAIRNYHIYLVKQTNNQICIQKMLDKQQEELNLVNAKLIENLPKDIESSFREKRVVLNETIEILNSYLKLYKV